MQLLTLKNRYTVGLEKLEFASGQVNQLYWNFLLRFVCLAQNTNCNKLDVCMDDL